MLSALTLHLGTVCLSVGGKGKAGKKHMSLHHSSSPFLQFFNPRPVSPFFQLAVWHCSSDLLLSTKTFTKWTIPFFNRTIFSRTLLQFYAYNMFVLLFVFIFDNTKVYCSPVFNLECTDSLDQWQWSCLRIAGKAPIKPLLYRARTRFFVLGKSVIFQGAEEITDFPMTKKTCSRSNSCSV